MRKILFAVTVWFFFLAVGNCAAIDSSKAQIFAGQDLHLAAEKLTSYQTGPGEHLLVFEGDFSLSIGANNLSSDSAVVRLNAITSEYGGRKTIDYDAQVYLKTNVLFEKGRAAKTTELKERIIENGQSLVVRFTVTGEVFATAQEREIADPRQLAIYKEAIEAIEPLVAEKPEFKIAPQARVPEPAEKLMAEKPKVAKKPWGIGEFFKPKPKEEKQAEPEVARKPKKRGLIEKLLFEPEPEPEVVEAPAEEAQPTFQYPVNIAGLDQTVPKIESTKMPDGTNAATVIGRFYLWQKLDEAGNLLELQADSAVIFYAGSQFSAQSKKTGQNSLLPDKQVQAVYLTGNIVMAEGLRTVRADEIYYDFRSRNALAINAELKSFDVGRNIPIYMRADKIRKIAENKFSAENAVLTTSEFYVPQISMTA